MFSWASDPEICTSCLIEFPEFLFLNGKNTADRLANNPDLGEATPPVTLETAQQDSSSFRSSWGFFFFFFSLSAISWATPSAYGGSQARGHKTTNPYVLGAVVLGLTEQS